MVDGKNSLRRVKKLQSIKQALKPSEYSCCKDQVISTTSISVYADVFNLFALTAYHISIISPSIMCNNIPRPNYLSIASPSVKSLTFHSSRSLSSVTQLPLNYMFLFLLKFFLHYLSHKVGRKRTNFSAFFLFKPVIIICSYWVSYKNNS